MKIRVTRDDIRKGKRKNTCECAVARALRRQTPFKHIRVQSGFHLGIGDDRHIVISIPTEVRDFIDAFDAGDRVKPFTFDLSIG